MFVKAIAYKSPISLSYDAQRRTFEVFVPRIAFVHGNETEESAQTAKAPVIPIKTKVSSRAVMDRVSVAKGGEFKALGLVRSGEV